jgi:hypothetical protein
MKLSSASCWKLAKVSTEEARMWGEDSLPPWKGTVLLLLRGGYRSQGEG